MHVLRLNGRPLTSATVALVVRVRRGEPPDVAALPNGIVTVYGYDTASQLTSLTYTVGVTQVGDLPSGCLAS